jgi:predicted MFS family arabinose efflux permease
VAQLAGPFVQTFLRLKADDLTILFAPAGVGLVLGGILMPLITRYLRKNVVIILGSIFTSLCLVLMPLSQVLIRYIPPLQPWSIFIIGVLAFILGVALDLINVPAQTVMQERAPEEERARVLSFQFMLYNAGSIPVLMFIGVIGQTLGIDTVMYFLGVAVLMFLWWTIRYERLVYGQVQATHQMDQLRHEA